MLNVEIKALGTALPTHCVEFKGGRRHRISGAETHLKLLCQSAERALVNSGLSIDKIDLILGACGVGLQPIPCTAALVHEGIAKGRHIPAFDVNSTCTSFITALDIAGYYIQSGKYHTVLIVSGDVPSLALNEQEQHSYELFGDGAVSAVISKSETGGILYCAQMTDSNAAHLTEIVGGSTTLPSYQYVEENKRHFQFHMEGKSVLRASVALVKAAVAKMETDSGIRLQDIDMIIPHQASPALGFIMRKLGIPDGKFIDIVKEYGNMVSASVPFALDYAMKIGKVKRGDTILLLGTAAGLTVSSMILKY